MPPDRPGVTHFDLGDGPADRVFGQTAPHHLDLGKFGHASDCHPFGQSPLTAPRGGGRRSPLLAGCVGLEAVALFTVWGGTLWLRSPAFPRYLIVVHDFWGLSRRERCLDNPQKIVSAAGYRGKAGRQDQEAMPRGVSCPPEAKRGASVGSLLSFVRRVPLILG